MHTYASAHNSIVTALQSIYDLREATAIAHHAIEYITSATRLQRITDKDKKLTAEQNNELDRVVSLLVKGTPLQYVVGYEWFLGTKFTVNKHVLIPRPETEELVQWVMDDYNNQSITVLDIGTGSGCIPISIKLGLSNAHVSAIDISPQALQVAETNAQNLSASVSFKQLDFLDKTVWKDLAVYDVVISNPPYIPVQEKETLHTNVRDHEPAEALFVPNDDALLFYSHISDFGIAHLKQAGTIYCELHIDYAEETQVMFQQKGYAHTELRKDMHGNLRMLKAQR